jgi:large subunit ribosomal protein L13
MVKKGEIKPKWYIVDASNIPLGRLASRVAAILRGKHNTLFTPHVDTGDGVIVINAKNVILTGKKKQQKYYYHHSGYLGGLKAIRYDKLLSEHPEKAIMLAVKRMLPKNSLGRGMLRRLRVYKDTMHPHEAQKPQLLKVI